MRRELGQLLPEPALLHHIDIHANPRIYTKVECCNISCLINKINFYCILYLHVSDKMKFFRLQIPDGGPNRGVVTLDNKNNDKLIFSVN